MRYVHEAALCYEVKFRNEPDDLVIHVEMCLEVLNLEFTIKANASQIEA